MKPSLHFSLVTYILLPFFVVVLSACAQNSKLANIFTETHTASLTIVPRSDSQVTGRIHFSSKGPGVHITGLISGIKPGLHGFHIHARGDCSAADGSSAGDHFSMPGEVHGSHGADGSHIGDLGNIAADNNGQAKIDVMAERLCLDPEQSCNIRGRSIVIHETADDLKSQPAGKSGARIACGVIPLLEAKTSSRK